MKTFKWNEEKNNWLKQNRNISFDVLVNNGIYLKTIPNPHRENQKILIYEYENYPYCIPYVEEIDYIFLKTIYPDRTKKYLLTK